MALDEASSVTRRSLVGRPPILKASSSPEWMSLRSFSRLILSRSITSRLVQHCAVPMRGSAAEWGSLVGVLTAAPCR
jgi:hypothetical protein